MHGCRAWYLLPLMWLSLAGGVAVYAMHRSEGWEGWFAVLAGNAGDPFTGDLLVGVILLVLTLAGHHGLRQHILCAHCSSLSRGTTEPPRYEHADIAPREPARHSWSEGP